MNKKSQIAIAAVMGLLGVALGAFGAHGLGNSLSEQMLETYKTGVLYHLIHSVVLLVLALSNYKFIRSFIFITVGILLFSFSLYIYSVMGIKFSAMVTPFGGVSFLIGWVLIIVEARNT
ncbi:MAG: DUF423 domain-containing protein [Ignavibacteriales bacterium]|jgi:uncharacterized membrane protein YgdD (TMEM256/DUF423 family)|nr:MAG: DUF423 domain-containing protein [Ignavibacteriales bacterium]